MRRSNSETSLSHIQISPDNQTWMATVRETSRPRSVNGFRHNIITSPIISTRNDIKELPGALISPDDERDWVFERMAAATTSAEELPDEYVVPYYFGKSREQKKRSTCAAFTGATLCEAVMQHRMRTSNDVLYVQQFSPEFIYFHRSNKPAAGMFGRDVFQILQRIGCVPEAMYQYRDDENATQPNKKLYTVAANNRISNYARINTVEGTRRAIYEHGPCYASLPLANSSKHFWRGKSTSSHAITIVGYNKTGFIIRNTWGHLWNGDGQTILPYEDWDYVHECWVATSAKPAIKEKRAKCIIM